MALTDVAPPRNFGEMVTHLGDAVHASGESAELNLRRRQINMALQDMLIGRGERIPWFQRQGVVRMKASYTTGTISTTAGTNSILGSSTDWQQTNTDIKSSQGTNNERNTAGDRNANRHDKIIISGDRTPYLVKNVASNILLYVEPDVPTTNAAGTSYTLFQDEYVLPPDFTKPVDMQSFFDDQPITCVSRQDFRRMFPRVNTTGIPTACTYFPREHQPDADSGTYGSPTSGNTSVGMDELPVQVVRFNCGASRQLHLPYTYVSAHLVVHKGADSDGYVVGQRKEFFTRDEDEPVIPLRWRHAVVMKALANWYRDQGDDTRSQEAEAMYQGLILRIIGDSDNGAHDHPALKPDMSKYRKRSKLPYKRGLKRYDYRGKFDRFEF